MPATMLAALRDAPVATLMRSLTMRPADESRDFTGALALLPTLSHPEVLSVLQLDNAFLKNLPPRADTVPLALFPALKELHLRGSFDGLAVPMPTLTVFSYCSAPSAQVLPPCAEPRWVAEIREATRTRLRAPRGVRRATREQKSAAGVSSAAERRA